MAYIQVSYCLIDDSNLFELLLDTFDEIKEVQDDKLRRVKTFMVRHETMPDESKTYCPVFISFPGIRPFLISSD